jgi:hypothetical protein
MGDQRRHFGLMIVASCWTLFGLIM